MGDQSQLESAYAVHHAEQRRYGFSFRAAERGPQFAAWIRTGKRVLDLGCRDGSLTQYYSPGNQVTGVDIDRQALVHAHDRLGIATLWLDLNRDPYPFEAGSFDVIVAGEVLEHLRNPTRVVAEARRILVPGGAFIGSVPNSYHWRARLASRSGCAAEDPTHLQRFSYSGIVRLLEGFESIELLPVGGIGGRRLPILPTWLSQPLVRRWPAFLANDFLFRVTTTGPWPCTQ